MNRGKKRLSIFIPGPGDKVPVTFIQVEFATAQEEEFSHVCARIVIAVTSVGMSVGVTEMCHRSELSTNMSISFWRKVLSVG